MMPGDRLAGAVQIGHAAPQVGPERHLPDVLHPDRRAVLAGGDHHVLEVGDGLGVAAAPHHVLGAAQLDHAAAGLVVAAADRLDHLVDRDVVGLQPVRIHVHLVLLAEPADGRHLGHAGHRLQVIAQIPVLQRTQVRQAVLARLDPPARIGRSSPRPVASGPSSVFAPCGSDCSTPERYSSVRVRAQ